MSSNWSKILLLNWVKCSLMLWAMWVRLRIYYWRCSDTPSRRWDPGLTWTPHSDLLLSVICFWLMVSLGEQQLDQCRVRSLTCAWHQNDSRSSLSWRIWVCSEMLTQWTCQNIFWFCCPKQVVRCVREDSLSQQVVQLCPQWDQTGSTELDLHPETNQL